MHNSRWTRIILVSFFGGVLLPACSTVNTVIPENMHFWQGMKSFGEDSPNLNNTPSDEAIFAAREQADELRERLENDRDRARRIAMGLPLPNDFTEKQQEVYTQQYDALTQTQRSMWIRHDSLMAGVMSPAVTKPVIENDLPPEMFVPENVVINYDIVPEAQYQAPQFATEAMDYIQTGSVITPSEPSDLINTQPIDTPYKLNIKTATTRENNPISTVADINSNDPSGLIFFGYGSSSLTETDLSFLQELATSINETSGTVKVIGHASASVNAENPTLGRAKNLMMSDKRAAAVMKALVSFGVDKDRIEVSAFGDSLPLFPIEGKTAEEADRRVEIYF